MDLIKKHYEKVLLGLVLLGLAVAAALLPLKISSEKQDLENQRQVRTTTNVKPLTNLNLTRYEGTLQRLQTALNLNFSSGHNLVNPVPWQKAADGHLIPIRTGTEVGPGAVVVTQITPLYLIISFDNVTVAGNLIGVENEAAATPDKRRKRPSTAPKTDIYTVQEVKGPTNNPTELVLVLNDTGQRVSIAPERPFRRVEGYSADLRYDPEKKNFPKQRLGSVLTFAGEEYNVVAITASDVVLSAKSTGKKTTIKFNPSAPPR
ncbi:MAG: hypothetical protein HY298_07490 [Verrucomicrobia bacterium]|nr:hypothetical protein [Verrucomicrobiota bacterium]